MAPKKTLISLLTVAGAALVVAGCGSSSGSGSNSNAASASQPAQSSVKLVAAQAPAPTSITLLVKSDTEKAKLGPDKQYHDAFLPAHIVVKAGETVHVTVWNYDDKHSFTAPSLGVNQVLGGGTAKAPHKTVFTFKAPAKPGSYAWFCAFPCDPWAMAHNGYMRGFVTVTA